MKRKKKSSKKIDSTLVLFGLAIVLLAGSAIGSTGATLNYYSENYTAQIAISQIGVSLLENGVVVNSRDYDGDRWIITSNAGEGKTSGILLSGMLAEGETLAFNKEYKEELAVRNSGSIDEYVRVSIYKSWTKNGEKVTTLSPDLIRLNLTLDGWVEDVNARTEERTVLYYKGILKVGETTPLFADTISIDGKIAEKVKVEQTGNVITTTYEYDGVEFNLETEVDAVQTHNAKEAIKSAWGIDAERMGIL